MSLRIYQEKGMKMKKILLIAFAGMIVFFAGCKPKETEIAVEQPNIVSTNDQIYPAKNEKAVEASPNVNGVRFTQTLQEFTELYNSKTLANGLSSTIEYSKWKQTKDKQQDLHGVEIQYYNYDDNGISLTATVEVQSQKLVNVGLGTTMSHFVGSTDNKQNSDEILLRAAIMAESACQFPLGSTDVLQNIFYHIAVDKVESLWYQGYIFALDTKEDKSNVQNNIMLFRVFPIEDKLKEEWKIEDYEKYIVAQNTQPNKSIE